MYFSNDKLGGLKRSVVSGKILPHGQCVRITSRIATMQCSFSFSEMFRRQQMKSQAIYSHM